MPQSKPKPSEIALEAKRKFLPALEGDAAWKPFMQGSCLISDTAELPVSVEKRMHGRPRISIEDMDPVNCVIGAKSWGTSPMCLVNTANEKKAGGDWESGFTAAEECLARRSSLVHALNHDCYAQGKPAKFYPIPQRGSIYSPHVVIFRDSEHGSYRAYQHYQDIAVISVAPIRGPRLDVNGTDYSFPEERELMEDKMKSILRTAAWAGCSRLCVAAFGIGPVFKNPAKVTAQMWKQLLFHDQEFYGAFEDIVFVIDTSSHSASKTSQEDLAAYRETFHPSSVVPSQYRTSAFAYD